jgi:hypothetical protein
VWSLKKVLLSIIKNKTKDLAKRVARENFCNFALKESVRLGCL